MTLHEAAKRGDLNVPWALFIILFICLLGD